jgi:hypothetical protein
MVVLVAPTVAEPVDAGSGIGADIVAAAVVVVVVVVAVDVVITCLSGQASSDGVGLVYPVSAPLPDPHVPFSRLTVLHAPT